MTAYERCGTVNCGCRMQDRACPHTTHDQLQFCGGATDPRPNREHTGPQPSTTERTQWRGIAPITMLRCVQAFTAAATTVETIPKMGLQLCCNSLQITTIMQEPCGNFVGICNAASCKMQQSCNMYVATLLKVANQQHDPKIHY